MKTRYCTAAALVPCRCAATVAVQKMSSKDFSGWMDDSESLVFVEDRDAFLFFNEEKRGTDQKVTLRPVGVFGNTPGARGKVASEATEPLTTRIDAMFEAGLADSVTGERTCGWIR